MRKIAVFTGTRAEYGLMYWIIKALHEDNDVELQLIVGGMHLSREFGHTIDNIVNDGFPITEKIEMLVSDTPVGIAKAMGLGTISAAESFARLEPDVLVLLGDRFEALAVAQAAMCARIPIAHIHGGEITEGLIDEAVRHSLTKMSHLHFTATEPYRQRVIQLGEKPQSVFNFGAPGIDSIVKLSLAERQKLDEQLKFDLEGAPYFLVTYHPVTLEADGAVEAMQNMLSALDDYPDHKLLMTYPNADTNGHLLIELLEEYKKGAADRVLLSRSLGQFRYLSAMKHCAAVIGNSSSGLIEVPTFNKPTVNIGNRQGGRLAGETVICCGESYEDIKAAIAEALSESFTQKCQQAKNPYGEGNASQQIVDVLKTHELDNIVVKSFYDIETDA